MEFKRWRKLVSDIALTSVLGGLLGLSVGCGADGASGLLSGSNVVLDDLGDGGNEASSRSGPDDRLELNAGLVTTPVSNVRGSARYRARSGRLRLKVNLRNSVPGSVHDILVNGTMIGTVTVGQFGEGQVEFDTVNEVGHVPWPAAFPTGLSDGDIVTAGPTNGVLVG